MLPSADPPVDWMRGPRENPPGCRERSRSNLLDGRIIGEKPGPGPRGAGHIRPRTRPAPDHPDPPRQFAQPADRGAEGPAEDRHRPCPPDPGGAPRTEMRLR